MAELVATVKTIATAIELGEATVEFIKDVLQASEDREKLLSEIEETTRILHSLQSMIDKSTCSSDQLVNIRSLQGPDGSFSKYDVALSQIKKRLSKKRWKFVQSFVWPWTKEEMNDLLTGIEPLRRNISWALDIDLTSLSLNMHGQISQIGNWSRSSNRERFANWLLEDDFHSNQLKSILSHTQRNTGGWFIHGEEFRKWKDACGQSLVCSGTSGTGKSTISALAIDHLQRSMPPECAIGFLFCNDQPQHSAVGLLKALLKQLLLSSRPVPQELESLLHNYKEQNVVLMKDDVMKAIQSLLGGVSKSFVIIDGLGDYQEHVRLEMLDVIKALREECDLRLIATTQHIYFLERQLRPEFHLEIVAHDDDVQKCFNAALQHLYPFHGEEQRKEALTQVMISSKGVFTDVRFHIDSLKNCSLSCEVEKYLETMRTQTSSHDQAYDQAFNKIRRQNAKDVKLAMKALSWLRRAKGMKILEFEHAMSYEPGEHVPPSSGLIDIKDVIDVCHGLLKTDQEMIYVRLVDPTLVSYLDRHEAALFPQGDSELARACITYLSEIDYIDTTPNEVSKGTGRAKSVAVMWKRLTSEHPLLCYASGHWGCHVSKAESKGSLTAALQEQVNDIIADRNFTSFFSTVCTTRIKLRLDTWFGGPPFAFTPENIAAYFDIEFIIESLLSAKKLFKPVGNRHSPITIAAFNGSEKVLRRLLQSNIYDIDYIPSGGGRTAICYAILGDDDDSNENVLSLLLEHGADPDRGSRTALMDAAFYGNVAFARKLLETRRIDVNKQNGIFPTAMHIATSGWRNGLAFVQLLLGTESKASGQWWQPLATDAVESRERSIAVDMNSRDTSGRTPFSCAAMGGRVDIVKALLEIPCIDINHKDRNGMTPLALAAKDGHWRTLKTLLETGGVDIEARNNKSETPLFVAVKEGHTKAVKILLRWQADVNTASADGSTPLHSAVENAQHPELINLLINDPSLDLHRKNNRGCGILTLAIGLLSAMLHRFAYMYELEYHDFGLSESLALNIPMSQEKRSLSCAQTSITEIRRRREILQTLLTISILSIKAPSYTRLTLDSTEKLLRWFKLDHFSQHLQKHQLDGTLSPARRAQPLLTQRSISSRTRRTSQSPITIKRTNSLSSTVDGKGNLQPKWNSSSDLLQGKKLSASTTDLPVGLPSDSSDTKGCDRSSPRWMHLFTWAAHAHGRSNFLSWASAKKNTSHGSSIASTTSLSSYETHNQEIFAEAEVKQSVRTESRVQLRSRYRAWVKCASED